MLADIGLPPVSAHMYDHYGRLARLDIEEYMLISEFDIWLKHRRRENGDGWRWRSRGLPCRNSVFRV